MMKRLLCWTPLLLLIALPAQAADDYKHGPDSEEHEGVPRGKITKYTWKSEIFPGTVRDYWIYVPAQYDFRTAAATSTPRAISACQQCSTT
jgi:hypothetical protein